MCRKNSFLACVPSSGLQLKPKSIFLGERSPIVQPSFPSDISCTLTSRSPKGSLGTNSSRQRSSGPAKKRRVSHKTLDRLAESTVDENAARCAANLENHLSTSAQPTKINQRLAAVRLPVPLLFSGSPGQLTSNLESRQ